MFMIVIHVFQMDMFSILIQYNVIVFNHNSCISNGHYLHFNETFSCLLSQFMYFKWTLFAF